MSEEIRMTDPKTGGQKGSKLERFDLIPVEPLEEEARVYGFGAMKYAAHNWRKGYLWSLSFAAMMRHNWAFWRGETFDPESKLHHLAHSKFHCNTLMCFTTDYPQGDDRYLPTTLEPGTIVDASGRPLEVPQPCDHHWIFSEGNRGYYCPFCHKVRTTL